MFMFTYKYFEDCVRSNCIHFQLSTSVAISGKTKTYLFSKDICPEQIIDGLDKI